MVSQGKCPACAAHVGSDAVVNVTVQQIANIQELFGLVQVDVLWTSIIRAIVHKMCQEVTSVIVTGDVTITCVCHK